MSNSGERVKVQLQPVEGRLNWGQFILDEKTFIEGFYTLRAYTNWMQNFGSEFFCSSSIQVVKNQAMPWEVQVKNQRRSDSVLTRLQLSGLNHTLVAAKELETTMFRGSKSIFRSISNTDDNGGLPVLFNADGNTQNLILEIKEIKQNEGRQMICTPLIFEDNIPADL